MEQAASHVAVSTSQSARLDAGDRVRNLLPRRLLLHAARPARDGAHFARSRKPDCNR